MNKKGKIVEKLLPILVAVVVCICTAVGFSTLSYLQGGVIDAPVSEATDPRSGIKYSVLEIEPCWDYLYDEGTNKNHIAGILGCSASEISFKYVSTAEFNGMNEDLVASYDIIVIGTKTGTMCTKDGKTIYNDTKLDGYIYLAYGDLVKYDDRMAGMLPYDYYSEKNTPGYIPVDDFINGVRKDGYKLAWNSDISGKSGYNGTLAKDSNDNAPTTNWRTQWMLYSMDNTKVWSPGMQAAFGGKFYILKSIDSTSWSNVTDFYNDPLGNARLSGNDISEKKQNQLIDFVNTGRPIVLDDALYNCVNDNTSNPNSNKAAFPTSNIYSFLNTVNGRSNVVKYSAMATTLPGAVHSTVLEITDHSIRYQNESDEWVDAPNVSYTDGILSDSCIVRNVERFRYNVTFKAAVGKQYYVKLIVDKNTDGRFNSVASVDDFNEVYYVAIVNADAETMSHELNINLPENYNGMFGWQILVEELDSLRNPIDRVSVEGFTVVKGETKKVKALQLLPQHNGELHMNNQEKYKNAMAAAEGKIGYDVDIVTMNINDFENWFITHPYTKGSSYKTNNDYFHVNGYNMLVIGFKDSYNKEDISDDYGALSCVLDYMNNGNSVLFSHDTMQFQPSANMGISYSSISVDEENKKKTLNMYFSEGFDERAGYIMTLGMRDLVGMDRYDAYTISSFTDPAALEAANVPKDLSGNYITEIQGFTDYFLLWMNRGGRFRTSRDGDNICTLVPNKGFKDVVGSLTDKTMTKKVAEINEGQITMYPYDVTSTGYLDVAKTHAQYFQLDMEDDELVVWYTLDKSNDGLGDYYGAAPKDAANNYYIYSKRNITYTGAGHANISGDAEIRLFVNTVIRAATAGNFVPKVTAVNGANTHIADTYAVYPKPYATEIPIQFRAYDEDLATLEVIKHSYPEEEWDEHIGRFDSGAIYWKNSAGELKVLKRYDRDNPDNYLLNGEITEFVLYNPIEKGYTMDQINSNEYLKNMYDCFIEYSGTGMIDLQVDVTDYYPETGSCTIQVVSQQLFELD